MIGELNIVLSDDYFAVITANGEIETDNFPPMISVETLEYVVAEAKAFLEYKKSRRGLGQTELVQSPDSSETGIDNPASAVEQKPTDCQPQPDNFVFEEAEPFNLAGITLQTKGKNKYCLLDGVVHISREGYDSHVFAKLEDLKRLKILLIKSVDGLFKAALTNAKGNKYTIIRTFLNEIDLSKLEPLIDESDGYKPILNTNTRTNYDGNKVEGTLEG